MVNKNKKTHKKVHLIFDEQKRREFLTGFHKRKLQRKKQAHEKLEKELKEEKKRLKQEAKQSYKKLVQSHKPIPELENLLAEEYNDEDVTVKVVELSTFGIANQNNWIGSNQPIHGTKDEENHPKEESLAECQNQIPGMELNQPKSVSDIKSEKQVFKSKKEVKKALKKQATKKVQKSKVFQMKNKIERRKQKKKSLQEKKIKMKLQSKYHNKKNKHCDINRR